MPSDDRDRQLEKALARHLRSDAIDAACPDAESLAAFHERTLSLEEMTQWKQHIAGCARCQETLKLVEESNILQGSEEENRKMMELVAGRLAAAGAAALSRMPMEESLPVAPVVSRSSAVTPMPKRGVALRWVVPVGALAAGLIVWVSVREAQQNKAMKSAQVEVAQNRPSVEHAPAASMTAPRLDVNNGAVAKSRDLDGLSKEQKSRMLEEMRKQGTTLSMAKPSAAPSSRAAEGNAANASIAPIVDKKKREEEDANALKDMSAYSMTPAPTVPATEVNNYAAQNRELPPTQTAQAASGGTRGVAASDAANTGRMLGQQNQMAKAAASRNEKLERSAGSAPAQSMSDVLPEGGTIIVAPNDAYSWRVGSNGKIEHSTDNSRTWVLQKSGVTADLTAGSATSGKVCWVVGKAGTVLLTTDRGKHWKQLNPPTKEDLGGVNAVDDKRASIWTVSHSKSFETNDAGATWSAIGEK
jgi:Photosynthesis system II assembly factor YCF48